MHFRKPALIPLLFIIVATLLLGTLGTWQVIRLQWKNDLNHHIAEAQTLPALGNLPESLDGLEYRNVKLTGVFKPTELHIAGGVQGEEYGFFYYTPLVLEDDGRVILVNRGFVPKGKEATVSGVQTVEGILRPERPKRLFTPANQPDKNVWFHDDLAAMSNATDSALLPLIVEANGKRERGTYPVVRPGPVMLRNDHLGYAIQWYALMIAGLVMFAFYQRKP